MLFIAVGQQICCAEIQESWFSSNLANKGVKNINFKDLTVIDAGLVCVGIIPTFVQTKEQSLRLTLNEQEEEKQENPQGTVSDIRVCFVFQTVDCQIEINALHLTKDFENKVDFTFKQLSWGVKREVLINEKIIKFVCSITECHSYQFSLTSTCRLDIHENGVN